MNPKQREALDLIRALAEKPARNPLAVLQSIARLARSALAGSTPPETEAEGPSHE